MTSRPEPATLLRAAELRVTRPRVAILRQLHDHPHADADTVAQAVRAQLGKVSTQAVYDVLAALTRAGLVRRIEPAGSPARYELRVDDNHHHLVCRGCGEITDVDCATGERPCLHASNEHGYVVDEAEIIYWGLCPACQAARAAGTTGDEAPTDAADEAPTDAADEAPTDARLLAEPAQRHTS